MWAPSATICHLVNGGVLMVSREGRCRGGVGPRRSRQRRGQAKVWDGSMQRSEVRERHEARLFLVISLNTQHVLLHCWYTLPWWSQQQADGQEPFLGFNHMHCSFSLKCVTTNMAYEESKDQTWYLTVESSFTLYSCCILLKNGQLTVLVWLSVSIPWHVLVDFQSRYVLLSINQFNIICPILQIIICLIGLNMVWHPLFLTFSKSEEKLPKNKQQEGFRFAGVFSR